MGIVLLYDCTSEDSFSNVRNWVRQIEIHANSKVKRLLVANKSDMANKVISSEQGQGLANEFGMEFIESSAKMGINVHEAFF